jgi:hypothetical protein
MLLENKVEYLWIRRASFKLIMMRIILINRKGSNWMNYCINLDMMNLIGKD